MRKTTQARDNGLSVRPDRETVWTIGPDDTLATVAGHERFEADLKAAAERVESALQVAYKNGQVSTLGQAGDPVPAALALILGEEA